jgi:hypothetical protein
MLEIEFNDYVCFMTQNYHLFGKPKEINFFSHDLNLEGRSSQDYPTLIIGDLATHWSPVVIITTSVINL